MVNTGHIMSLSTNDYWEELKFIRRIQNFTNEYVNMFFEKVQDRYEDGEQEDKISGMLFGTYSEIDLWQLENIVEAIESRSKIKKIDTEAILSVYEGQTIFSIFYDRMAVYEQILA